MSGRYLHVMGRGASVLLLCLLLAAPAWAGNTSKKTDAVFWNKMKAELQFVVPERKMPAVLATEAESRREGDASNELYWKGRGEFIVVPEAELAAFNRVLQFVTEGKHEPAIQGFEDFLAQYPGSRLADYARAALTQLKGDETP